MVNSVLFEVGLFNEYFAWGVEHRFGCVKANALDSLDYPLFNLICKLVEVDIIFLLCVDFAVYVDGVTS